MEEVFKPIPLKEYRESYELSNFGRMKSFRNPSHREEKFLRPSKNHKGYPYVIICKDSVKKIIAIHRWVAILFVDNPDNKPQVNHIDGNKDNFRWDNLEWVTCKENVAHAFKIGLRK